MKKIMSSFDLTPFPFNALKFFETVGKLKVIKRTGWVKSGIPNPESISDHMYRMSMMSFLLTTSNIDKTRILKICMVHDLAESLVGDFTPHCAISKEEKRRLEETALRSIITDIGNESIGDEILSLWLEFEEQSTEESQIALQLDKFEMIVQADEYERAEEERERETLPLTLPSTSTSSTSSSSTMFPRPIGFLEGFFSSTEGFFSHPQIQSWDRELRERREERKRRGLEQEKEIEKERKKEEVNYYN